MLLFRLALVALSLCSAVAGAAQDSSGKTLRIIVPFSPGGGTDIVARLLAKAFADMSGQPAIVENRAGAAGVIGSEIVAKSAPDGHTLLLNVNAHAANHTLYPKLPYDTLKDFAAVVLVGSTPSVLIAHPSLPAKTAKQFVALAKARPNQIAYASTGTGGAAYLAAELFKLLTQVQMLHVPYKGAGPALIGLMSGETQAMIVALPPTVPYVRQGRVRALGVASAKRAALTPDIPTLIEAGIPGMEFDTWYGLFAPSGGSREVIVRLNASVNKALASAEFKEQFGRQGIEPAGGTPEQFEKFFRSEVEKLAKVIRASGAKPE